MKKRNIYLLFSITIIAFLFQGCISVPKPRYFNLIEESLFNIDCQSIMLLNIRTKNTINTKHCLSVINLVLEKDGQEIIYMCNNLENTYRVLDNHDFTNTFILLILEPGIYNINVAKGITWVDKRQRNVLNHRLNGIFLIPIFNA